MFASTINSHVVSDRVADRADALDVLASGRPTFIFTAEKPSSR